MYIVVGKKKKRKKNRKELLLGKLCVEGEMVSLWGREEVPGPSCLLTRLPQLSVGLCCEWE